MSQPLIKNIFVVAAIIVIFVWLQKISSKQSSDSGLNAPTKLWTVQSIDTMKYSRDLVRQEMTRAEFDSTINLQMDEIADTGATHVAIGTPYDAEFTPFLKKWVDSARAHKLHVWFRGNFSGWEGWFGYPKITRDQHLQMTKEFIGNNPNLFEDGDIFSSCPECENGGPGDPRSTGDVVGFRQFLIDEESVSQAAFSKNNKQVLSNYFSMNGDVAKLVMDKDTTTALGGVVVIDHYVASVDQMIIDIDDLASVSGGEIVLGEFGAPIPDLNGKFTDEQQKNWMQEILDKLALDKNVIGLNYWVNVGGSTEIWTQGNEAKPSVNILQDYYKPQTVSAFVLDEISRPIANAKVSTNYRQVQTNSNGRFSIPVIVNQNYSLQISAPNFIDQTVSSDNIHDQIVLRKTHESLWFSFIKMIKGR